MGEETKAEEDKVWQYVWAGGGLEKAELIKALPDHWMPFICPAVVYQLKG